MRLVAYLRVSTDAQTDGLGLDVQAATITKWARDHHHTIVATFADAGVSGIERARDAQWTRGRPRSPECPPS